MTTLMVIPICQNYSLTIAVNTGTPALVWTLSDGATTLTLTATEALALLRGARG